MGGRPFKPGYDKRRYKTPKLTADNLELHPTFGNRTAKGHFLGKVDPTGLTKKMWAAIADAITTEEVLGIMEELKKLCLPGDHGSKVQLEAIKIYLDRCLGRPLVTVQETQIKKTELTVDYSGLSDQELNQLATLASKVTPKTVDAEYLIEDNSKPGENAPTV